MDNERIREICLAMTHTAETLNWGMSSFTGWAIGRLAARCSP